MNKKLEFEGAEAKLILINETTLKKIRLEKKYRHETLDKKLRNSRNKREFKVLTKLHENKINVPKTFELISNKNINEVAFTFEYINALALKESLTDELLIKAFNQIIKIHNQDITHGDLTTLNMLNKNGEIYVIDFGLAQFSNNIEEKAVDLNLFFTCIKNEHPEQFHLKEKLIQTYSKEAENGENIIERLNQVELRGRNKNK